MVEPDDPLVVNVVGRHKAGLLSQRIAPGKPRCFRVNPVILLLKNEFFQFSQEKE